MLKRASIAMPECPETSKATGETDINETGPNAFGLFSGQCKQKSLQQSTNGPRGGVGDGGRGGGGGPAATGYTPATGHNCVLLLEPVQDQPLQGGQVGGVGGILGLQLVIDVRQERVVSEVGI